MTGTGRGTSHADWCGVGYVDTNKRPATPEDCTCASWRVTSEGHPVREFTDQQEAEDYAASWNRAYPPSEGYTEFILEAVDV